MPPTTVLLAEMTREAIRKIAPGATVILPTAAIEQHGPHLPIVTDTLACSTICQRAAEAASKEVPVYVAPILPFGHSHHHFPHPGVFSFSTGTFVQVLKELGESCHRSGFRRIVIVNGHGGNDELVRVAARDIGNAHPVSIAAASYWTIGWKEVAEEAQKTRLGHLPGHAGAFETSLVMALRPELVDKEAYPEALPPAGVAPVPTHGPTVVWAGQSLGTGPGYTDDPSQATPTAGQAYLDAVVRGLAQFLVDFHRKHPTT